jgi:ectoine hydroxylase-related dioxygenase (phytanoyl-CoA dioxygenase family)
MKPDSDLAYANWTVPKGSVVLMHYDLLHRASANVSKDKRRFMFKFQFVRMSYPSAPSWDCQDRIWRRLPGTLN